MRQKIEHWLTNPVNFLVTLICGLLVGMVALFVYEYGKNIPIQDQWWSTFNTAIATAQGKINLSHIFDNTYEHFFVTSHLITVLTTYTTNWNLRFELAINFFLMMINTAVVSHIIYRAVRRNLGWHILLVTLLFFSFRARASWLWSLTIAHHIVFLSLFLGILVLQKNYGVRKTFFFLSSLSFIAIFSFSAGISIVFVFLLGLIMYGYRQYPIILAWGIVSAILVSPALMMTDTTTSFVLSLDTIKYALVLFATPMMPEGVLSIGHALSILLVATTLVSISSIFIYQHGNYQTIRKTTPYGLIGLFGSINFILIVLRRSERGLEQIALSSWYGMLMMPIWLAILGVSLYACVHSFHKRSWHFYTLSSLLIVILGFYIHASHFTASRKAFFSESEVECIAAFPLSRDISCTNTKWLNTEFTVFSNSDMLAWHRLALYTNPDYHSSLTKFDSPVPKWGIIDLPTMWQHLHLERRLQANLSRGRIVHLVDSNQQNQIIASLPFEPQWEYIYTENTITGNLKSLFTENGLSGSSIWYATTADYKPSETGQVIINQLEKREYYPKVTNRVNYPKLNVGIIEYVRQSVTYRYGENLFLHNWHLNDVQTEPCSTISLDQNWRLTEKFLEADDTYSTLILVDNLGQEVARSEQLIPETTNLNWLFPVSHKLSIPCNVATGNYDLLSVVYQYNSESNEFQGNIRTYTPSGIDTYGYLTTIYVNRQENE